MTGESPLSNLRRAAAKWAEQVGPEGLALGSGPLLTGSERELFHRAEQVELAAARHGLDREALATAVSDALAQSWKLEFDDALRSAIQDLTTEEGP